MSVTTHFGNCNPDELNIENRYWFTVYEEIITSSTYAKIARTETEVEMQVLDNTFGPIMADELYEIYASK